MSGSTIPAASRRVVAREAIRFLSLLIGDQVERGSPELKQLSLWAGQEWQTAEVQARLMLADRFISMLRGVRRAIASGTIPAQWDRNERTQELVTTGLQQYDPRVAFQAALRTAYSAGRWERGMEDDTQDFWLYRTMRDSRVRDSHEVLNGVYLPKAHPFWKTHFPPNGWRCRCRGIAINQQGIDRLTKAGLQLQNTPPEERTVEYRDRVTGEVRRLPASIEPGWDYNSGTDDGRKRMAEQMRRRVAMLEDPSLL